MPNKKQKLVFLDRWSRRKMGASVMRVQQLSQHMRHFHGDKYDVHVAYISKSAKHLTRAYLNMRFPEATFLFSKYAALGWTSDDMLALQKQACSILVDYVDMPIANMHHAGVNCHLSTSYTGTRLMNAFMERSRTEGKPISGTVATVLHNFDSAIQPSTNCGPADRLAVAYIGSPEITRITPFVEKTVTFLDASSPPAFLQSIRRLNEFNAHYCIRKVKEVDPGRIAKPFTKGATAAACGAVILTERDTDDVIEQLGEDYPFLIADNSDSNIDNGLRHLQEAFGGHEWAFALDRLKDLHELTSHRAIATQLHNAIQSSM